VLVADADDEPADLHRDSGVLLRLAWWRQDLTVVDPRRFTATADNAARILATLRS
jgi:hypothetical protein